MYKVTHIVLGAPDPDAVFPEPHPNDAVIGVDRGAIECYKRDIPLTLALGDFDSISIEEKENIKAFSKQTNEFPADKDDTDTELALELALTDYPSENIILYNWLGGRADHLMSILHLIYQPRFEKIIEKIIFKNEKNHVQFFMPGNHEIKADDSMSYISFIGMTPIEKLTLKNLKYPLENASYAHPVSLVSNEMLGSECQFSFEKGLLGVIQSRD
ncbi:thiamine diphosphokinase [Alkalibacterium iburiense]|uniref:Thiamine diphosphokinase n=1 Tax=Alkalibacterium iburiense TaxID=290589 RepID=A0ABN0X1D0_9LACT